MAEEQPISFVCPVCTNASLFRVVKIVENKKTPFVVCKTAGCTQDSHIRDFRRSLTFPFPVPCPDCGYTPSKRKTKDSNSRALDYVVCGNNCGYEGTVAETKARKAGKEPQSKDKKGKAP
jgi:predicted RNA-binding Zn-ribbon protein involved in translation (DUF1610 family)